MSAWNTEAGGETFADVVKHSEDNESEQHIESSAPSTSSDAVAAPVQVTEDEFPELPHDETTPKTDSAAPAQTAERSDSTNEAAEEVTFDPSDVLAFGLSSAFSPPPPPAKAKVEEPESSKGTITPVASSALPGSLGEAAPPDHTENSPSIALGGSPDPTLVSSDNWKAELDERTLVWKAENHVAREKAEKSRAHWEAVRDEERKAAEAEELKRKQENKDKVTVDKKVEQTKKPGGVEKELGLEAGAVGLEVQGTRQGDEEARWAKVGQAWEGVGDKKETHLHGDAKVENGVIVETVDPSISSDPPPADSDWKEGPQHPITGREKETGASLGSRRTVDSKEVSGPIESNYSSSDPTAQPQADADLPISHYLTHPGGAPPSLTLALFTSKYLPPRRRILLGLACFSINVILPFIGGMMAGWGEITAKLLMDVARDTWFGTRGAGRGVGGVGLGQVREGSIPRTEVGREAVKTALVDNPMEKAFP